MRRLSFVPNGAARQLAVGQSREIGLVLLDLENPFFLEVARGVQDVASANGRVLMLFNSSASLEREAQALLSLQEHRVSGALVSPVAGRHANILALRESGTHVVVLDRSTPESEGCSVAVDDYQGGLDATRHLLAQGHRALAFIGGPQHIRQHRARLRGARAAADEQTSPVTLEVLRTEMSVAGGENAARTLLSASTRPTGVFCANDVIAFGVERVILQAGLSVPGDIAIVGYDDVPIAAHASVPITTVSQPMYEMGQRAAELLLSEIDDPSHIHHKVTYTPTLVTRESA